MKDSMRRFVIDRLISEKGAVTFDELCRVLQVSAPTVKRDLRYMREVLKAPIVYSRSRGGYFYESCLSSSIDDSVSEKNSRTGVPKSWYGAFELYVLLSTIDLLTELADDPKSALGPELSPLRARVASILNLGGIEPRVVQRRIKVVNKGYVHTAPHHFSTVGYAICVNRRLEIEYYTKSRDQSAVRVISPQRLVCYRHRWYVDAWCHATSQLKTFSVDNIRRAIILDTECRAIRMDRVEDELDSGYGIFHGRRVQTAELRFSPHATYWVKNEIWHPKQRCKTNEDGSMTMKIPFSNATELLGDVLRWGSDVEVVGPDELRRQVKERLEEMLAIYR